VSAIIRLIDGAGLENPNNLAKRSLPHLLEYSWRTARGEIAGLVAPQVGAPGDQAGPGAGTAV